MVGAGEHHVAAEASDGLRDPLVIRGDDHALQAPSPARGFDDVLDERTA
jgi:hypothetical protein